SDSAWIVEMNCDPMSPTRTGCFTRLTSNVCRRCNKSRVKQTRGQGEEGDLASQAGLNPGQGAERSDAVAAQSFRGQQGLVGHVYELGGGRGSFVRLTTPKA